MGRGPDAFCQMKHKLGFIHFPSYRKVFTPTENCIRICQAKKFSSGDQKLHAHRWSEGKTWAHMIWRSHFNFNRWGSKIRCSSSKGSRGYINCIFLIIVFFPGLNQKVKQKNSSVCHILQLTCYSMLISLFAFAQKSPGTAEKGGSSRMRSPGPAEDGLPQRSQHHWGTCTFCEHLCILTWLY